eukprot:6336980-Prorocentrum_lima.AAC.1
MPHATGVLSAESAVVLRRRPEAPNHVRGSAAGHDQGPPVGGFEAAIAKRVSVVLPRASLPPEVEGTVRDQEH